MSPTTVAVQVADLRPRGVLHRAVTLGQRELQEHLPVELRRQYLHELFPDLSVDANYEEEPDHHQLIVLREDFVNVSYHADVTRCGPLMHLYTFV